MYLPLGHSDTLRTELVEGALVVYVDIAPPNRMLRRMADAAAQIIVLDHHVSSKKRFESDLNLADEMRELGHEIHFDLEHSGSVLAWNYFHPRSPVPDLLRYIEDQDLWRWELPQSREINAAIGSYPQQLEVWDELLDSDVKNLIREGIPLLRANQVDVEKALKTAHPAYIGSERIEAVNCTSPIRSAIGHQLAERAVFGKPWGLVYRLAGKTILASIYSIGELDVSEVAAKLGGGGHANASGFHVSIERWLGEFLAQNGAPTSCDPV